MTDFKEITSYYIGNMYGYEALKVVADFGLNYNIGTAVSYLLRAGKKPYVNNDYKASAIADIEKTINHLKAELEILTHGE